MVRLLVVEDDIQIVGPLTRALNSQGYAVAHVLNGFSALEKIKKDPPDLLLLDSTLPDIDGVKVCQIIRDQGLDFPIIMMAGPVHQIDVIHGLDAGADDFLVKPLDQDLMFARLRAAVRRSPSSDLSLISVGNVAIDLNTHVCTVDGNIVELTLTEFNLLNYLMRNHGRAIRRSLIIREIWETTWTGPTKNLDMHISTLRRKLGPTAAHIQTIRGMGYMFEEVS
jgi:DNA-binding response OmpR family regulator